MTGNATPTTSATALDTVHDGSSSPDASTGEEASKPQPLPGRAEVAEFLGMTVDGLTHMHHRGGGPPYSRIGRHARYTWPDVHRWVAEQIATDTAARTAKTRPGSVDDTTTSPPD